MKTETLLYQCLRCHVIWSSESTTLDINESNVNSLVKSGSVVISSGICPICFRGEHVSQVRKYQIREGNSDCFLRNCSDCKSKICSYRTVCQDNLVSEWKSQVITYQRVSL